MLAAAARAKGLLDKSAADIVAFVLAEMNPDGGFKGRSGASDLYYTVFGIEAIRALGGKMNTALVSDYTDQFADGRSLDLVHLACLARCRANLAEAGEPQPAFNEAIARSLELYRCADGGYGSTPCGARGTAYGCFLALGAYQDLELTLPDRAGLAACICSLARDDGGYANDATIETGSTPATAAAVAALHYLGESVSEASSRWLLSRGRATGGFLATPTAPIPDMLSTATAVHALALAGTALDSVRQPTLEFIDSLWSTDGAFAGNWLDDTLDCEYTYYALLALGHLIGE